MELDRSIPLVIARDITRGITFGTSSSLGDEEMPDPAFDNAPDWTLGTNVTVDADGLVIDATVVDTTLAETTVSLTEGDVYQVEVEVLEVTEVGAGVLPVVGGSEGEPILTIGTHTQTLVAGADTTVVAVTQPEAGFVGVIGHVSVRGLL